ncbi:pyruvate kinase [Tribolium castaneum]|uniref:pyruvate kinase n=1 Tax=Tribolium castaneum TaxID=7070 RepID=UPI0030FE825C
MVWYTRENDDSEQIKPLHCSPPKQLTAGAAYTQLDHNSLLDIQSHPPQMRLTGIICTLGPSTTDVETLERMIEAGMNIARLTLSHGTQEMHTELIQNVRTAVENYSKRLGVMYPLSLALDIKGPEVRTGYMEGGIAAEVELKKGEQIKLTTDKAYLEKGSSSVIYVDYDNIQKVVQPGNRIFLDDGLISLICTSVQGSVLTCSVENGGMLGSCKNVNLPGIDIDLPVVSEKDKEDLLFGVEHGIDTVHASFIRNAVDVSEVRDVLGRAGNKILIISKIENHQGVHNIDEIIKASDGIMIGRGDLAVEIGPEKLFLAQKSIIAKCNKAGKPVICANQLLYSMIKRPRPTRAECTDVANAVLDGVDCVMLTGETFLGQHPIECIRAASKICKEAEGAIWYKHHFRELIGHARPPLETSHTICIAAVEAANQCLAAAIIVTSVSGRSAHSLAKYRPNCPIILVTRDPTVAKQANLFRGIIPLFYEVERKDDWRRDIEARISFGISFGKWRGFVRSGDPIVAVNGSQRGSGYTDTIRVLYVMRPIVEGDCTCDKKTGDQNV